MQDSPGGQRVASEALGLFGVRKGPAGTLRLASFADVPQGDWTDDSSSFSIRAYSALMCASFASYCAADMR
jgi:hypothetical protein